MTETEVLIVGAGPAGLAVAACLKERGIPALMLERAELPGSSWRGHYHRLHLHTERSHSSLPLRPMPRHYPRYPSRQQVVEYLSGYARHFDLQPLYGRAVTRAERVDGRWQVQTQQGEAFRARHLVVATGVNSVPSLPTWPGQDDFQGEVQHSSAYQNGRPYRGKRVLVVGMGNSGGEIALDLWEHAAQVTLAVRSPINVIPKEVLGISYLTFSLWQRRWPAALADRVNSPTARRAFGDLRPYGLHPAALGPTRQIREQGRVPFIDTGTISLIKAGEITVRPGIQSFTRHGVTFTDGSTGAFDAVVLATGYTPNLPEWLHADPDVIEHPARYSGKTLVGAGLSLCGYYVSPYGMLREIALEAQAIAGQIAAERTQKR